MKTMLSKGLMAVAMLSLSLPLTALAQSDVESTTTTRTTTTTTSSAGSTAPVASTMPIITETIVMDTASGQPMSLPQVQILPGSSVELTAMNFSAKPMTLSIPSLGVNQVIPPNSQVPVDLSPAQTASLTGGQNVAYYVLDENGNQIASSSLVRQQEIVSRINTDTTIASTETEEKTVTRTTTTERRSSVRGYW